MPNLVFKFNWDHRPIPINTGQGRLQFSLPFASGSLSLAPNFSQVQGTAVVAQGGTGAGTAEDARKNLGAAASGTNSDITEIKGLTAALSVTQGGTGGKTASEARTGLGLGTAAVANVGTEKSIVNPLVPGEPSYINDFDNLKNYRCGFFNGNGGNSINFPTSEKNMTFGSIIHTSRGSSVGGLIFFANDTLQPRAIIYNIGPSGVKQEAKVWLSSNTTVDANGYIKAASPICNLYVDHIELNDEAKLQEIIFEKVDVGNYLIRGSLGFAQEGWYIEMPKDANGNVLVAVKYQQLESGDIQVKTFAKKFDEETGDIIPNLLKPRDIPEGRFISLRLQGLPEPEFMDDPEIMESDQTNTGVATAEDPATQSPEEQPAK